MADDNTSSSQRRSPMNVDTAMLLLSFVALSIGCLVMAIDLFTRRLPIGPPG